MENLFETEIHDVPQLVQQLQQQGISGADYPWPGTRALDIVVYASSLPGLYAPD